MGARSRWRRLLATMLGSRYTTTARTRRRMTTGTSHGSLDTANLLAQRFRVALSRTARQRRRHRAHVDAASVFIAPEVIEDALHVLVEPAKAIEGEDILSFPYRFGGAAILGKERVCQAVAKRIETIDVLRDRFGNGSDCTGETELCEEAHFLYHVVVEQLESLRSPQVRERTSPSKEEAADPVRQELIDQGVRDDHLAPHQLVAHQEQVGRAPLGRRVLDALEIQQH